MENNKLTPKQRDKIYLKAAKYFDIQNKDFIKNGANYQKYDGIGGFCDYLEVFYPKNNFENFKEYQLYSQNTPYYWFDHNSEGRQQRIIALLFAYQMALDATE